MPNSTISRPILNNWLYFWHTHWSCTDLSIREMCQKSSGCGRDKCKTRSLNTDLIELA